MKRALLKFAYLLIASLCFTNFLYGSHIGINLPLTELIVMIGLLLFNRIKINLLTAYYFLGWIGTSVAVVFVHTNMSIWMNLFFFTLLCIRLIWPELRNSFFHFYLWIQNLYNAQQHLWVRFAHYRRQNGRGAAYLKKLPLLAIIIGIVVIFILLYNYSSQYFQNSLSWFNEVLNAVFTFLIGELSFWRIQFFILGFTLISALVVRTYVRRSIVRLDKKPGAMQRIRKASEKNSLSMGLKRERGFGVVLLILLNLVIALQNTLDIKNIWIDFQWDGGVLKQFVHAGTSILILSILISGLIAWILFRRNQNFYKNNRWLKGLTYLWLVQNAVLALSVGMRNYWYIRYFNIAYLRIGVFIFLVLVLAGLALVVYKILKRQSALSILGKGIHITLFVLLISSFVNWDRFIVNYNIDHREAAYFHRDFMVTLPNNTLGILRANEELFNVPDTIDSVNYYTREYFGYSPEERTYSEWLHIRYSSFIRDWESRNWRTWNFPEAEAYEELMKQPMIAEQARP